MNTIKIQPFEARDTDPSDYANWPYWVALEPVAYDHDDCVEMFSWRAPNALDAARKFARSSYKTVEILNPHAVKITTKRHGFTVEVVLVAHHPDTLKAPHNRVDNVEGFDIETGRSELTDIRPSRREHCDDEGWTEYVLTPA